MERMTLTLSEETARLARQHGGKNLSRWVDQAIRQAAMREELIEYRQLTDELGVNTPEYMQAALREREEMRRAAG